MNEKNDLMKLVSNMTTRDRQPIPKPKPVKGYDTSEIYDDPGQHMTVRGMFQYVGIDIIEVK